MKRTLIVGLALLVSTTTFAQSPYSGMQTRPIKALSEQQVADLKAGRGMGLALAAELNGYPGPSHVLELADKLDLSADQRARIQKLFALMKQEALPLGTKLIDQEAELDRQFANRAVTPDSLNRDCGNCGDTRRAARSPPQISPIDGRDLEPRTNAAVCRTAGLWRPLRAAAQL